MKQYRTRDGRVFTHAYSIEDWDYLSTPNGETVGRSIIESILGYPLEEVQPEPEVWENGDGWQARRANGRVEQRFQEGHWYPLGTDCRYCRWCRIIAALLENDAKRLPPEWRVKA